MRAPEVGRKVPKTGKLQSSDDPPCRNVNISAIFDRQTVHLVDVVHRACSFLGWSFILCLSAQDKPHHPQRRRCRERSQVLAPTWSTSSRNTASRAWTLTRSTPVLLTAPSPSPEPRGMVATLWCSLGSRKTLSFAAPASPLVLRELVHQGHGPGGRLRYPMTYDLRGRLDVGNK